MDIKFKTEDSCLKSDQNTKRQCEICLRNPSSYTCPRCHIFFCSSECYRNGEKHLTCSESFFQEQVVQELKMCKLEGAEEKSKMLEILKRESQKLNQENYFSAKEEQTDANFERSINEKDLVRAYRQVVKNWRPWWRTGDLVSKDLSNPKVKFSANLMKNASKISLTNANFFIYNDILLLFYCYFIIAHVYQLEKEKLGDINSFEEISEIGLSFLEIDRQIVSDQKQKSLDLKLRLNLCINLLCREESELSLKSYISPEFLLNQLSELEFIIGYFNIEKLILSQVYDLFEIFVHKSKSNDNETSQAPTDMPLNVFHLNRSHAENLPIQSSANKQTKIKILSARTEKKVNENQSEENADLPANKYTYKDAKLYLKRLEFYFTWLNVNQQAIESKEFVLALKNSLKNAREDLEESMKKFESEKEIIEKNLRHLRKETSSEESNSKRLIEEL